MCCLCVGQFFYFFIFFNCKLLVVCVFDRWQEGVLKQIIIQKYIVRANLLTVLFVFSVYMFSLTVKPVVAVTAGSLEQAL